MSLTPAQDAELLDTIAAVLAKRLEPLFVQGMELTFIARLPGNDEADVLVSSEKDLSELSKLIQRSTTRSEIASDPRRKA